MVVVVDAPETARLDRLVRLRVHERTDQAEVQMAAQASRAQRLAIANLVVDNAGSLSELDRRRSATCGRNFGAGPGLAVRPKQRAEPDRPDEPVNRADRHTSMADPAAPGRRLLSLVRDDLSLRSSYPRLRIRKTGPAGKISP